MEGSAMSEIRAEKIFENTWAIMDLDVRIFVLAGSERALIIDTGISGINMKEKVKELTDLPAELLNTHADPDHVAGNGYFESFYMHPSEAFVYHRLREGKGRIIPVYEGDIIDLGERELRIVHIPGHTPGSISVLDVKSRILFGGDSVQKNGFVLNAGIHRDMESYILGLEHLMERDDFDAVCSSHADLMVEKDFIPVLIEGTKKIMAGEIKGQLMEMAGTEAYAYDVGGCTILGDYFG